MKSYGNTGGHTPMSWAQSTPCVCLGVPQHSSDCPGRNGVVLNPNEWVGIRLMEDYRVELDKVVDLLLDGQLKTKSAMMHLRGQAEMLAWCIAKMQNQAEPNIDAVREESMRRWEARLAAANGNHVRKVAV